MPPFPPRAGYILTPTGLLPTTLPGLLPYSNMHPTHYPLCPIPDHIQSHPLVAVGEVGTPTSGTYTVKTTMSSGFYELVYYRYVCGRLSAAPAVTARRVVGGLVGPACSQGWFGTPKLFAIIHLRVIVARPACHT